MDKQRFWQLIEQSKAESSDCDEQAQHLTKSLAQLEAEEIIGFDKHFTQLGNESYRWDLWAVAYLVLGGCSDDSFDYFRSWLISQGQEFFEQVMANPELAADRIEAAEEGAECEEIMYAAAQAYQQVTGQELPAADYHRQRPEEPIGQAWEEDDLEAMYPDLWQKYFGDA
jgi:hypothetical protein